MTGFRYRPRVLAARRLLARFRVGWWIDRRWPLYAELRNCPACRDGRKVADTTIRNAHGI